MVLHNPNNWHWVNKDAAPWAREYLENELIGLSAESNGVSAKIDKILSMDGDVDVSQRKGKVITLFDVKLQLEYSGKTKEGEDGEDVSGTISVPEVAHDTEEDEYVFDIDIYSDASSKTPVKDLVRSKITPQLRQKLASLGPALVQTHAKDLQHAADADPSKNFRPATKYQNSSSLNKDSAGSTSTSAGTTSTSATHSVNVTTVTDTEEFRAPASELFKTFTDPQRIAAFTRAPPSVWESGSGPATEGAKFEIFGGNVSGEYVVLEEPKKLVQRWRLKQWPTGHFSRLEIAFDQNDVDNVTAMRVTWTGVPIGQEEATKRNWREYYIRSIKTTFGFGTIL